MFNYKDSADHTKLKIVYEDTHTIAVNKSGGVLVQGDYSNDITLIDMVRKYLAVKYNKAGNVFLGLVHRIDKPACGLVIFGKTSKGASRLSEQFRERKVKKIYYAMVEGNINIGMTKTLKSYLVRDKDITKMTKSGKNGQYAELNWECMSNDNNGKSLLKINLVTGRKHQIRSQLSNEGFPILGDKKYGAKKYLPQKDSIALMSKELHFSHVTEKRIIKLSIDTPIDWGLDNSNIVF